MIPPPSRIPTRLITCVLLQGSETTLSVRMRASFVDVELGEGLQTIANSQHVFATGINTAVNFVEICFTRLLTTLFRNQASSAGMLVSWNAQTATICAPKISKARHKYLSFEQYAYFQCMASARSGTYKFFPLLVFFLLYTLFSLLYAVFWSWISRYICSENAWREETWCLSAPSAQNSLGTESWAPNFPKLFIDIHVAVVQQRYHKFFYQWLMVFVVLRFLTKRRTEVLFPKASNKVNVPDHLKIRKAVTMLVGNLYELAWSFHSISLNNNNFQNRYNLKKKMTSGTMFLGVSSKDPFCCFFCLSPQKRKSQIHESAIMAGLLILIKLYRHIPFERQHSKKYKIWRLLFDVEIQKTLTVWAFSRGSGNSREVQLPKAARPVSLSDNKPSVRFENAYKISLASRTPEA